MCKVQKNMKDTIDPQSNENDILTNVNKVMVSLLKSFDSVFITKNP